MRRTHQRAGCRSSGAVIRVHAVLRGEGVPQLARYPTGQQGRGEPCEGSRPPFRRAAGGGPGGESRPGGGRGPRRRAGCGREDASGQAVDTGERGGRRGCPGVLGGRCGRVSRRDRHLPAPVQEGEAAALGVRCRTSAGQPSAVVKLSAAAVSGSLGSSAERLARTGSGTISRYVWWLPAWGGPEAVAADQGCVGHRGGAGGGDGDRPRGQLALRVRRAGGRRAGEGRKKGTFIASSTRVSERASRNSARASRIGPGVGGGAHPGCCGRW